VEGDGGDTALFVEPLDGTLGCVIVVGLGGVVEQEINAADGGVFACFFVDVGEFLLIVLQIINGQPLGFIGVFVVAVGAAVFLLAGKRPASDLR